LYFDKCYISKKSIQEILKSLESSNFKIQELTLGVFANDDDFDRIDSLCDRNFEKNKK
jgi:hypothetical protein